MEFDADLHSTSRHVNDEAVPLSAPESIVEGKQHECPAYSESGEDAFSSFSAASTDVTSGNNVCRQTAKLVPHQYFSAFLYGHEHQKMPHSGYPCNCNDSGRFPDTLMPQLIFMPSAFNQSSLMLMRITAYPIDSCFGGQLGMMISFAAAKLPRTTLLPRQFRPQVLNLRPEK